ncbi:MAG: hypothetical protein DMF81_14385 [Acidobacteria bacterium]|nr:MAG: hypothetical protein DMF81_14385 [Acidobacteriota bacterium]
MATVEGETRLLAAVPAEIRGRIFAGMRWALWLSLLAMPFGYGTNILLARAGPEVLGTYGLLMVYLGVVSSLVYLGGDAVVVRFLPRLRPADRLPFLVAYFLVLCGWLGLWLLAATLWPAGLRYLFGKGSAPFQILLLGLASICLLLSLVTAALKGLLEIRLAQGLLRLLTVGQFVVYAALLFGFRTLLAAHYRTLIWAVYLVLALLAASLGLRHLLGMPQVKPDPGRLRLWLPDGFWRYTLSSQAVSVIWFFLAQFDSLLVLNLGGLAELGRYVAVMTFPMTMKAVSGLFLETFLPSLTNVLSVGPDAAGAVFKMYWRLLLLINAVAGCGLILFVGPLSWLLGPGYSALRPVLILILLLMTLASPAWIGGFLLAGVGRQSRNAWIGLGQLGLYLALFIFSWPLVRGGPARVESRAARGGEAHRAHGAGGRRHVLQAGGDRHRRRPPGHGVDAAAPHRRRGSVRSRGRLLSALGPLPRRRVQAAHQRPGGRLNARRRMRASSPACRLCGSRELSLIKPANYDGPLASGSFAVTDSAYGVTAAVYRCGDCGFLQCPELEDVLGFYEGLRDEAYEAGRRPRSLQCRRILRIIRRHHASGRLLDIGAGTGSLVEQALAMGYRAEGVEPSRWMQARAVERGLPVRRGTLPHPVCRGPYGVVTLIDVIEHVSDPLGLLRAAHAALEDEGVLAVATPDVGSLAARLMGWRWWHFRLAHIGYFDRRTLDLATARAGFQPLARHRPGWFFSADYLLERALKLLAPSIRVRSPGVLRRLSVPVNLGDSLLGIYRKTRA